MRRFDKPPSLTACVWLRRSTAKQMMFGALLLLWSWKPTQVLQVNADLVHPSGERFTEHHARVAVEADFLERRRAVLAARRHFADADFVANHLDGLLALDHTAG